MDEILTIEEQDKEEMESIISNRKIYSDVKKACPWCNGITLEEETFAYEKVVYCTNCAYSESKTI